MGNFALLSKAGQLQMTSSTKSQQIAQRSMEFLIILTEIRERGSIDDDQIVLSVLKVIRKGLIGEDNQVLGNYSEVKH